MGSALLSRWQKKHPAGIHRFRVIEPMAHHANTEHVSWFASLDTLPKEFTPSVIVFATKPQELPVILPAYRERFAEKQPLYISIAAGKSLRFYLSHLGDRAHIIRAMPNTPALIGEAMTVLCASPAVPPSLKKIAIQIMEAVGHVVWIDDESQMDAVTAISGSGPAYVFLFLDSLTKAGVEMGLSEQTARHLAVATVSGSSSLAEQSSDSLEQLRKDVTSPGGTTEAALRVLMENNSFEELIKKAAIKAAERSKELEK